MAWFVSISFHFILLQSVKIRELLLIAIRLLFYYYISSMLLAWFSYHVRKRVVCMVIALIIPFCSDNFNDDFHKLWMNDPSGQKCVHTVYKSSPPHCVFVLFFLFFSLALLRNVFQFSPHSKQTINWISCDCLCVSVCLKINENQKERKSRTQKDAHHLKSCHSACMHIIIVFFLCNVLKR